MKSFTSSLKQIGIGISIGIISFFISAFLTGRTERTYDILPFDEDSIIGGEELSGNALAEMYTPILLSHPQHSTQRILRTWYEIIENKDSYDVIYYPCWENEKSNNLLHTASYAIFRSVYYGYPLYDIEYILIRISKKNGEIIKSTFITSSTKKKQL
jgi:hypothetical protein